MKKSNLLFQKHVLISLILSFLVINCKKTEIVYSCDPQINTIVKSGVNEFSQISLKEFLEYDFELQKAIYRSFSNEKKINFWSEKLDSVITNYIGSKEEIDHIEKLKTSIITQVSFDSDLNSEKYIKQLKFIDDWLKYAREYIGWSNNKIHFIAYSLCITESQYTQFIEDFQNSVLSPPTNACRCSLESDDCGTLSSGGPCISSSCVQSASGCGFLWLFACDGYCM